MQGGPLPRGPLLPPQRDPDRPAAAARALLGRARARRTLPRKANARTARPSPAVSPEAMDLLAPRAGPATCASSRTSSSAPSSCAKTNVIRPEDLPSEVRRNTAPSARPYGFDIPADGIDIEEFERQLIVQAMEKSGWVIAKGCAAFRPHIPDAAVSAGEVRIEEARLTESPALPIESSRHRRDREGHVQRLMNFIRGFFGLFVSGLERSNPEALLKVEKSACVSRSRSTTRDSRRMRASASASWRT